MFCGLPHRDAATYSYPCSPRYYYIGLHELPTPP